MLLKDLTATEAARRTGLKLEYFQVILAAAKRHAPEGAVVEFAQGLSMDVYFDPSKVDDPFWQSTVEVMSWSGFASVTVNGAQLVIRESAAKANLAKKGWLPAYARVVKLADLEATIEQILRQQSRSTAPKSRHGLFGRRQR